MAARGSRHQRSVRVRGCISCSRGEGVDHREAAVPAGAGAFAGDPAAGENDDRAMDYATLKGLGALLHGGAPYSTNPRDEEPGRVARVSDGHGCDACERLSTRVAFPVRSRRQRADRVRVRRRCRSCGFDSRCPPFRACCRSPSVCRCTRHAGRRAAST